MNGKYFNGEVIDFSCSKIQVSESQGYKGIHGYMDITDGFSCDLSHAYQHNAYLCEAREVQPR